MSLLEELRRRNVFRVAIAYIIVAWILIQVADALGPALRLPEWFQSGVVFVLILGFPLATIFAWAFELTPEGLKREKDVDRAQSITHVTGQKLNGAIIALLAVAVTYLALDRFVFEHDYDVETAGNDRSIAVLPFANMSDDAGNEYFADGITEELLNLLAKIPELQVTSRTSAFQFKDKDIDIPTVAKQLNVQHVLEGSVRKSDSKVRITAQLIDARTDRHIWSETYDRQLDDIFAIQDEIARQVVDVLQVTLLGEAPTSRETDTEAYAHYLEGRHFLDRDDPSTWPLAKEKFEKAIDIDPNYAPAWYGRARAIRELANFGLLDLTESTELARKWVLHALELDATLAEAWSMLAHIALIYDWDWESAQQHIGRALAVGPSNPEVLQEASRIYQVLGQLDQMIAYAEKAVAQDPLSNLQLGWVADAHWYRGDFDESERLIRKNISLHGADASRGRLPQTWLMQGRHAEAEAAAEAAHEKGDPLWSAMHALYIYPYVGRRDEARAGIDYLIENKGSSFGYQIAEGYALLGDADKAFAWLEQSYKDHDGGLTYLLVDHFLAALHEDPRWRPFLEKMNLLDYWDAMPVKPGR